MDPPALSARSVVDLTASPPPNLLVLDRHGRLPPDTTLPDVAAIFPVAEPPMRGVFYQGEFVVGRRGSPSLLVPGLAIAADVGDGMDNYQSSALRAWSKSAESYTYSSADLLALRNSIRTRVRLVQDAHAHSQALFAAAAANVVHGQTLVVRATEESRLLDLDVGRYHDLIAELYGRSEDRGEGPSNKRKRSEKYRRGPE